MTVLRSLWEDGPIGLSVNVHNHFILGISIKEHSLSGGVYNLRLEEIFFTESEKLDLSTDPMKYLIDFIQKLMDSYPNKTFCAIGVALPAIIDERRERVLTSLGITMFGEDIKSALEEHFGIPVMLDNEGRAAGLAEKSTYYPEVNGFVYFSLIDKGLGGFVTSRYDLSRPSVGVSAEIGHMSVDVHGKRCRCGNHGCLEALASIEAMVTSYAAALNVPEDSVSYHDLVMAFLGQPAGSGRRCRESGRLYGGRCGQCPQYVQPGGHRARRQAVPARFPLHQPRDSRREGKGAGALL